MAIIPGHILMGIKEIEAIWGPQAITRWHCADCDLPQPGHHLPFCEVAKEEQKLADALTDSIGRSGWDGLK